MGDHSHSPHVSQSPNFVSLRRRVLIIGGSFSGLAAGRDLGSHYLVTIIDAKDGMAWDWEGCPKIPRSIMVH